MTEFARHAGPRHRHGLTARQQQVLSLVAEGRTNAEIGEALGISFETAKMHVGDILDRLGVDSREEAASIWRSERSAGSRVRRSFAGLSAVSLRGLGIVAGGAAAVAVAATVAFAMFGSDPGPDVPPAAPEAIATPARTVELIGTRWELLTVGGQKPQSTEFTPYLLLHDDGTAGGYGGCNWFGGTFSITASRLDFEGMSSTARACGALNIDAQMPLSDTQHMVQSGDRLSLTAADGTVLEFVARTTGDPDGILTSDRWQLLYLDGRSESAYQGLIFDFADDGTFSTATSCGTLRGTFERTGFEMTIAVVGETPVDCPEPDRALDANIRSALGKTTKYWVDRSTLSISQGDTGALELQKVEP